MATETWTVQRLLQWTEEFLKKKGIASPRLEAQILLAHALGCKKIQLYVRYEEEPAEEVKTRFREMIKKRAEGMPNAYLVGYREFFSLEFAVTPAVLIPRPETEQLVMEVAKVIKPLPEARLLDIGTGSGCITISLAKHHPTLQAIATDISQAALDVAKGNASKHTVQERIDFRMGSMLEPVVGEEFDVIVSNPPYITPTEIETLDISVKNFEPRTALDGGPDGLTYYRQIATNAPQHLKAGGLLMVEIGYQQEAAVRELFMANPALTNVRSFKDFAGHPRVVAANKAT